MINLTKNQSQREKIVYLIVKILLLKKRPYSLMLLSIALLCTYTARSTNSYLNTPFNDANSVSCKNIPWKTPARVISFTSRLESQILFKIRNERVINITGSNSLYGKMVCFSDKTEEYLTFVRKERNQLVLIPILELKISFSHPQYQHLSY